jgi:hypothetical protein
MHILIAKHPVIRITSRNLNPSVAEDATMTIASPVMDLSSTDTSGIGRPSVVPSAPTPVATKGVQKAELEKPTITEQHVGLFKYFTKIDWDQLREQNHKQHIKDQEYRQHVQEKETHHNLEKAERKHADA